MGTASTAVEKSAGPIVKFSKMVETLPRKSANPSGLGAPYMELVMSTSVPDLMHSELVMSTSVPDLMHSELEIIKLAHSSTWLKSALNFKKVAHLSTSPLVNFPPPPSLSP